MGSSSESTSSPSDSPGRGSDEDKSSSKTDSSNTSRGGGGADSGSAANPSSGASFDRAMDNAARPDRAPAASPSNDDRPDRAPPASPNDDPNANETPSTPATNDERPDRAPAPTDTTTGPTSPNNDNNNPDLAAAPPGIGAPPDRAVPAAGPPSASGPTDNAEPEAPPNAPNAPSNPVADFFGGLARDFQDFARENPRVDSHGNPVGLVDANGIQHGEIASGAMASGRTPDQLARDLGFSSPQEMSTAQNTDFIADEYKKDLTRRAVTEALNPKSGLPPDAPGAYINAFAPVLDHPPLPPTEFIPAGFQAIPPDMIIDSIMTAAELMPDIPPDVWGKTAEVMKDMYAGAVDGAIQGFAFGVTTGALPAGVVAMADSPIPGPADIAAGIGYGIYTGATTAAGAIAGGGAAAIEGLISRNTETPPEGKDGQMYGGGLTEEELEALQEELEAGDAKGKDGVRKGATGDNTRQIDQVNDAANQVGLTDRQRNQLGKEVEKQTRDHQQDLGYGDIVGIARDVKDGKI